MKKFSYLLCMAFIMMLAACSDDDFTEEQEKDNSGLGEMITITVGMPEYFTNTRVDYNDEKLSLSWENGDVITIVGFDENGTFKGISDLNCIKVDNNNKNKGTFTGYTVAGAKKYRIYYKAENITINSENGTAKMSYDNQLQDNTNPTAHVKKCLFLKAQKSSTDASDEIMLDDLKNSRFFMTMQNGIFRFDIESLPKMIHNFNKVAWVNNYGGSAAYTVLNFKGTYSEADKDNSGMSCHLFICFDPQEMELHKGQDILLRFYSKNFDGKVTGTSVNGKKYDSGNRYHAKVSNKSKEGYISNWLVVPVPGNDAFVIKTTDGIAPSETLFKNLFGGMKVTNPNATDGYFILERKDGKPITEITGFSVSDPFFPDTNISEIYLPSTLERIGGWTFYGCSKLKYIEFPLNLKEIGTLAFTGTGLTTVTIPASVTTIDTGAFRDCPNLTNVYFQHNSKLNVINSDAFRNSGLTELMIPESVYRIGSDIVTGTPCKKIALLPPYTNFTGGNLLSGRVISRYWMTVENAINIDLYINKEWANDPEVSHRLTEGSNIWWNNLEWKSVTPIDVSVLTTKE